MATTFKIGDVVRLKSGGPSMTVTHYGDDGFGQTLVWCSWFDKNQKEEKATFPPDAVELA